MHDLRRLIDNPPPSAKYSQVSLSGDQLVIKTQVGQRYPIVMLLIAGAFFGTAWGVGWLISGPLNCCILGLGVYGFILFRQFVGSKKRLGVGSQTLRISREGIEITHAAYAIDAKTPAQQLLPLKDVQTYYLDETLKRLLAQRLSYLQTTVRTEHEKYAPAPPAPVPPIKKADVRRPGIYFVATDGASYVFDTLGLARNGGASAPDPHAAFVESEWLFAIITRHLQTMGIDAPAARQAQRPALLNTLRQREHTLAAQGDPFDAEFHSAADADFDLGQPISTSLPRSPSPIEDTDGW